MADVALDWGNDIQISAAGDLQLYAGAQDIVARVLRRALTNCYAPGNSTNGSNGIPADFIWVTGYGNSLRALVDSHSTPAQIQQRFLVACQAEQNENGYESIIPNLSVMQSLDGTITLSGTLSVDDAIQAPIPLIEIT